MELAAIYAGVSVAFLTVFALYITREPKKKTDAQA